MKHLCFFILFWKLCTLAYNLQLCATLYDFWLWCDKAVCFGTFNYTKRRNLTNHRQREKIIGIYNTTNKHRKSYRSSAVPIKVWHKTETKASQLLNKHKNGHYRGESGAAFGSTVGLCAGPWKRQPVRVSKHQKVVNRLKEFGLSEETNGFYIFSRMITTTRSLARLWLASPLCRRGRNLGLPSAKGSVSDFVPRFKQLYPATCFQMVEGKEVGRRVKKSFWRCIAQFRSCSVPTQIKTSPGIAYVNMLPAALRFNEPWYERHLRPVENNRPLKGGVHLTGDRWRGCGVWMFETVLGGCWWWGALVVGLAKWWVQANSSK